MSAYFRGYHAERVNPKTFNDFLANNLLTGSKNFHPKLTASFSDEATALAFSMQMVYGPPQIFSRASYAEDFLKEQIKQGLKQYIILGAGMDTFAFRYPEMLEKLQLFELDHPATQNFKLRRVKELKWEIHPQVHFTSMDLTRESLVSALKNTSYDSTALSLFSWLGVTYYLSYDSVIFILKSIADISPPGSIVIFDYLDVDAFDSEKAAPRVKGMFEVSTTDE